MNLFDRVQIKCSRQRAGCEGVQTNDAQNDRHPTDHVGFADVSASHAFLMHCELSKLSSYTIVNSGDQAQHKANYGGLQCRRNDHPCKFVQHRNHYSSRTAVNHYQPLQNFQRNRDNRFITLCAMRLIKLVVVHVVRWLAKAGICRTIFPLPMAPGRWSHSAHKARIATCQSCVQGRAAAQDGVRKCAQNTMDRECSRAALDCPISIRNFERELPRHCSSAAIQSRHPKFSASSFTSPIYLKATV